MKKRFLKYILSFGLASLCFSCDSNFIILKDVSYENIKELKPENIDQKYSSYEFQMRVYGGYLETERNRYKQFLLHHAIDFKNNSLLDILWLFQDGVKHRSLDLELLRTIRNICPEVRICKSENLDEIVVKYYLQLLPIAEYLSFESNLSAEAQLVTVNYFLYILNRLNIKGHNHKFSSQKSKAIYSQVLEVDQSKSSIVRRLAFYFKSHRENKRLVMHNFKRWVEIKLEIFKYFSQEKAILNAFQLAEEALKKSSLSLEKVKLNYFVDFLNKKMDKEKSRTIKK